MRPTVPARRSAAALVAALVVLPGCGAADQAAPSTAEAGPASSSASEATGERADSEFCTAATALQEEVVATLGAQPDPATVRTALQQAAAGFRAVEPPEEIAADWNALGDGVEQIATTLASTDFEDPGGRAAFQEQVGQLQTQVGPASADVGAYLRDECDLDDAGGSEPPAPSD